MFEQELYKSEVTQVESQDGDLFHNYEIRNWNYSSALYKILAISAVLNIAVLAFIGQTNLLTLRGCDSPFVGRVCQVLDMAYVGTVLFGTEREYVDMEYEKTDLGDAEITYIDVSGETPPLSYPEGYFQIANPVQYAMLQQQAANPTNTIGTAIPGFPMSSSAGSESDLLKLRPNPPAPNPNAFQEDKPPTLFGSDGDRSRLGGVKRRRGGRVRDVAGNDESEKPDDKTVAAATPTPTPSPDPQDTRVDPVTGNVQNLRPWKELRVLVKNKISSDGLDLQSNFVLKANVKLNKDGKIDPKTIKYSEVAGDKKLIKIVQEALAAFSDSGQLQVLKDLSGKDLSLEVTQDELNVSALVQSQVESPERATTLKSSLDLLIGIAKKLKSGEKADDNDRDDLALLERAVIKAEGKNLIIRFDIPKAMAHQMIQKKLVDKPTEEKKPSGNASMKPVNDTAVK